MAGRPGVPQGERRHPVGVDVLGRAFELGERCDVGAALHVILVPEPLAVARVQQRVEAGGHDVPEDKIRGRFARLWGHLREGLELCDETFVYDNTRADRPYRKIATFMDGMLAGTPDWPPWTPIELRSSS